MAQENLVKLQCTVCKRINYHTTRNKKAVPNALELKKFCRWCKKHQVHKEMKK
ncbi:MAG: 50S ribosomal protein L33 [Candidatus Doudnabacteria bacterium RIFCSPHIGHO2_01_FULL_46_14]|uniref:Large ribosomal subunit protein bL33 n=1 Tax=Candidatus Doudnabacteria bacterium RIFCSPHIGHO2_01_FULL_46_14 TaxID=1817824 RepID=A0A1F5NN22_9BACT|nr:MAG: 50S ribosomal protein L33 [Candidatus Doudnabacteria bacterium RIFCSPHIGHO2_01_FULL_46_14]